MAAISNLYIDQGSDYTVTITVENKDISDYDVAAQMRKSYGSTTAYPFTCSVTDGPAGKLTLVLLGEDSDDIPAGRYLYDVEITSEGGSKTRVVEGIVILSPQITRAVEP